MSASARALNERIESTHRAEQPVLPGHHLSLAIGIASCDTAAQVEATLNAADKAMFREKARYYEEAQLDRRRN